MKCRSRSAIGATTSIFPFDETMARYLRGTRRAELAALAEQHRALLEADAEVEKDPEKFFDRVIEINLSKLEPHLVGPHTPDLARPVSQMAEAIEQEDYPDKISATDVVDGNSVAILCTPTTLVLGANSVSCTATDSAGNEDTKSLTVTVELSYVIRIDPPKGNIRAGSTVPIDFRYLDRVSGQPIDSAGFSPSATWAGFTDSSCMTPNGRSMGSDDAGSSNFRYGFPTWQYSWQTPSDASGSYLRFTVKPPNAPTAQSSICVRIR